MAEHTCMVGGTGGYPNCRGCRAERRALATAIRADQLAEQAEAYRQAEREAVERIVGAAGNRDRAVAW